MTGGRMRFGMVWGLAGALVAAPLMNPAAAQDEKKKFGGRGFGGMGMGGPGMMMGGAGGGLLPLLSDKNVAGELKLTDEEKDFAKLLGQSLREEMEKSREKLREEFGDDRQAMGQKMMEMMREQGAKTEKQVEEIIGKDRLGRLKQIQMQVGGIGLALMNPETRKKLDVSEDQQKKIQDEVGNFMREQMQNGPRPDFSRFQEMTEEERAKEMEGMRKRMEDTRAKSEEMVMKNLTDAQKGKWKELIGTPITYKVEMGMGGMMGRGGRGGRGGNAPKKDA
jgi:hypothetical protein